MRLPTLRHALSISAITCILAPCFSNDTPQSSDSSGPNLNPKFQSSSMSSLLSLTLPACLSLPSHPFQFDTSPGPCFLPPPETLIPPRTILSPSDWLLSVC
ncbi:hypothetical protein FPQ18DRAFT_330237 [Pyronema domesticum]|nr:hypothetical protein FPQ18DRAFT_330237 [Pyronema domesticum]